MTEFIAFFKALPYLNLLLAAISLVFFGAMLVMHRNSKNPFDAVDLLIDHTTGRASLDKAVVLWGAVLSNWVVVDQVNRDKDPTTLLLGILGIFILKRGADKAIDVLALRSVPRKE